MMKYLCHAFTLISKRNADAQKVGANKRARKINSELNTFSPLFHLP